jgi:hypothetical protein
MSDKIFFQLAGDDRNKIAELHQEVLASQTHVAHAESQVFAAEAACTAARLNKSKVFSAYVEALAEIARAQALNIHEGGWEFDPFQMSFIKRG